MDDVLSIVVSLLDIALQVVLWYIFFTLLLNGLRLWLKYKGLDSATEERQALVKRVSEMIHYVAQEKHGEVYYWFDKDTDAFLGQGRTDDEIRSHLLTRFRGHIFLIDEHRALAGPKLESIPIEKLKLSNDLNAIQ